MKRTLLLNFCLFISVCAFAQDNGAAGDKGRITSISFGLNRATSVLFRGIFGREEPYVYNFSAQFPARKSDAYCWNFGIDFGDRVYPGFWDRDFFLGLEGGIQHPFLSPDSPWILNGQVSLFLGRYSEDYSFDRSQLYFNTIGVTPEIQLGKKLNDKLSIFTSFSTEIGYFDWGGQESGHTAPFAFYPYRFLSVQVKYNLAE
ncbi:MAG TPA: hypothetical protein VFU15_07435 [Bacteroidia bacterium]|nr:hypothetical protein [Bacteroidia bacterium]